MDCGVTRVETRVEEPDWIDHSHSSKRGELCKNIWGDGGRSQDCWYLSDATAGDLLEGQQACWSYDNNRHHHIRQSLYFFYQIFWCLLLFLSYPFWVWYDAGRGHRGHILVHPFPSTFLSCTNLVQASVLPRTRSNAGLVHFAFPPSPFCLTSLFTIITPEIQVIRLDAFVFLLFHDAGLAWTRQ